MILDFSKCQTPEDVEHVFAKAKPQLDAIRKGFASLCEPTDDEAEASR